MKKRFIVSIIATIPILLLSPTIQEIFAFSIVFPGSVAVLFLLANFVYAYGGWPFLKGCVSELKQKKAGMMTLVALAITSAHTYSVLVALKIFPGKTFFWEVATLIDVMLLGHWIEMKTMMRAHMSLEKLVKLVPANATLLNPDGSTKTVPQKDIKQGDKVLVRPGEKIPIDGIVVDGISDVNESALTGESKLVPKTKGDKVVGGSINQNGSLVIEAKNIGKDSYIEKLLKLVHDASASKSRAQTIADKAAFILTIIAIIAGTATLGIWLYFAAPTSFALERMITVMVITCPHALGLAIPLVISGVSALSAQNGLLVRNRTAFERASKCKVVLFDKTGTLTTGTFGVTKIIPITDWTPEQILYHAAAIEQRSEHSIAKAIVRASKDYQLEIPHIANFKAIPGLGATGFVEQTVLFVGSPEIISGHPKFETNFVIQNVMMAHEQAQRLTEQGKTVVVVVTKNEIKGLIAVSDTVRKESLEACSQLKKRRFKLAMVTGDNEAVARNVADQLGIKEVFSQVLPEEKVEIVKKLQAKNKSVIMVGDGINDAPALAQADVGIAIGSGTDVAAETADIILVHNDPRDVVKAVALSKITRKKMFQNLAWATGYNIAAIPIAAGALYQYGILLPPAIGALVMSLSTIIVAFNSRIK
jgi:Cu2+-exporting ATPase